MRREDRDRGSDLRETGIVVVSRPVGVAAEKGPSPRWLPWAVAAVLAAATGALAWRSLPARGGGSSRGVTRLAFLPPDGVAFDATSLDFLSLSPDGRLVVFTGRTADGKAQLWLRSLDSSEARPLPGSEDAVEPFWSPDSRSIGFGARGSSLGWISWRPAPDPRRRRAAGRRHVEPGRDDPLCPELELEPRGDPGRRRQAEAAETDRP